MARSSAPYGAAELQIMGTARAEQGASSSRRRWMLGGVLMISAVTLCVAITMMNAHANSEATSLYGFLDAPTPSYDKGLDKEAEYWDMAKHAKQSTDDMSKLVDHYSNLLEKKDFGPKDLDDGLQTLHAASHAWVHHHRSLGYLNREIVKNQVVLHRMHLTDRILTARHGAIKKEIAKLTHASAVISHQLEELRGRYSDQIQDLKSQYKDTASALKLERQKAFEELNANKKEEAEIRKELDEAMQKAAYFKEQARHAEEDVEGMRARAHNFDREGNKFKKEMYETEDLEMEQKGKTQKAKAGQKAARLQEGAIDEVTRMKARADAINAARGAEAIKIDARSKVQQALQSAAESAQEAAVSEKEETDEKIKDLRVRIWKRKKMIRDAKSEAAAASVDAQEYTEKMRIAKRQYDKIMELIKTAEDKTKKANQLVDTADAKKAEVETQGKIAELIAEADAAHAAQMQEDAESYTKEAEGQLELLDKDISTEEGKKDDVHTQVMEVLGNKLHYDGRVQYNLGQAKITDRESEDKVSAAERKREEAEKLLNSVKGLAHLAKEAAEIAAAERIKAQAANIGAGVPAVAAGAGAPPAGPVGAEISNPSINVHVVPHPGD